MSSCIAPYLFQILSGQRYGFCEMTTTRIGVEIRRLNLPGPGLLQNLGYWCSLSCSGPRLQAAARRPATGIGIDGRAIRKSESELF